MARKGPVTKTGKIAGGENYSPDDREDIKVEFLKLYAQCGSLKQTCAKLGVPSGTIKHWMEYDMKFADKFGECRNAFIGKLENIATDRAVTGSDSLLMFLLKANDPEKYNPGLLLRASTSEGDKPAQIILQFSPSILTEEEVALLDAQAKATSENNQGIRAVRAESSTD